MKFLILSFLFILSAFAQTPEDIDYCKSIDKNKNKDCLKARQYRKVLIKDGLNPNDIDRILEAKYGTPFGESPGKDSKTPAEYRKALIQEGLKPEDVDRITKANEEWIPLSKAGQKDIRTPAEYRKLLIKDGLNPNDVDRILEARYGVTSSHPTELDGCAFSLTNANQIECADGRVYELKKGINSSVDRDIPKNDLLKPGPELNKSSNTSPQ